MRTPKQYVMDDVLANSFKNFHAKGLDYICVKANEGTYHKLYFFDGDVSKLPEVVNPHNHRYNFTTWVMTGASQNIWYRKPVKGVPTQSKVYNKFKYSTPLNGGSGFTWDSEEALLESFRLDFTSGKFYRMYHNEIHTIRMMENETVLYLRQYKDQVPVGEPTDTYCIGNEPPSLSGLYEKFTADEVLARLSRFAERTGITIKPK